MKILIFHQPFPMGNYKLHLSLGSRLKKSGHEIHLIQQFNSSEVDDDAIVKLTEILNSNNYDAVYFEMLDLSTFEVVKNLKCKNRILCITSGGVWGYNNIIDKFGIYYDKVYTNSKSIAIQCHSKIPNQLFHYYFNCIDDSELVFNEEYNHSLVFVGMGFNRLYDDQYEAERTLFFENPHLDLTIYGNGWTGQHNWRKILPAADLGSVYFSSDAGIAIIAQGQRNLGMINNRYTEMMYCGCPIITINYPSVDWYGAEKYLYFVNSPKEVIEVSENITKDLSLDAHEFIINQDRIFFEKLNVLLNV